MKKKILIVWIIISICLAIAGWLWSRIDARNAIAMIVFFLGGISSLLAVGYYSTPSNSIYGKVAFGFVIVIVIGIVFKILHLEGADLAIICGLCGVCMTYILIWIRTPKGSNTP
jgi:small-conductance mechanosensitive channel